MKVTSLSKFEDGRSTGLKIFVSKPQTEGGQYQRGREEGNRAKLSKHRPVTLKKDCCMTLHVQFDETRLVM